MDSGQVHSLEFPAEWPQTRVMAWLLFSKNCNSEHSRKIPGWGLQVTIGSYNTTIHSHTGSGINQGFWSSKFSQALTCLSPIFVSQGGLCSSLGLVLCGVTLIMTHRCRAVVQGGEINTREAFLDSANEETISLLPALPPTCHTVPRHRAPEMKNSCTQAQPEAFTDTGTSLLPSSTHPFNRVSTRSPPSPALKRLLWDPQGRDAFIPST